MSRLKHLNQAGFTIVELLIAMSLASAVTVLVFGLTLYLYGDLLRQSARSDMVLESQLFLKEMSEDIRGAGAVRAANQLSDPNAPSGGWATSDPANTLILTFPATNASGDFVYSDVTGYPYQNELVYFGDGSTMRRRIIANPDAQANGSVNLTTCPTALASSSCPEDSILSKHLGNLLFTFYDIDDNLTTTLGNAYAVQLTVNLTRPIFGQNVSVSQSVKATMRNNQNL